MGTIDGCDRCDRCGGTEGKIDRSAHVAPDQCVRALQRQVSEALGIIATQAAEIAGVHAALDTVDIARAKRSVLPEFDPTILDAEGRTWLLVPDRNRLAADLLAANAEIERLRDRLRGKRWGDV